MAYTTAALLKTYLGATTATDDTLLTALIVRAQAIIDAYCQRTFEAASNTSKTFDAERDVEGQMLYLDEDLAAINSVTNGDGTVVTTYTTEPRNRTPYYAIKMLDSATVFWTYSTTPENAITISGKWAYSVAAPEDIVHCCLRLAAYLYRQRDNAADLDRAVIAGNATILPAQLPADIKTILAPYRRLV